MNTLTFLFALLFVLLSCSKQAPKIEKIGRVEALVVYYSLSEGESGRVAGNQLFQELLENPQEWYEAMSEDTLSFNRFLRQMENVIFAGISNQMTIDDLENMRIQAIDRLKRTMVPSEFENMHNKLIQKLESIKPEAS